MVEYETNITYMCTMYKTVCLARPDTWLNICMVGDQLHNTQGQE